MKHEPLCYKLWAKIAAYILLTLIVIPLVGSVAGIVFDVTTEAYQKDVHDVRIVQFSRSVSSLGFTVLSSVLNERASRAQDFADMSNATFRVVTAKTALQRVQWTAEDFGDVPETYAFVLYYTVYEAESAGYYYNYDGFSEKDDAAPLQKGHARVYVRIDPSFPIRDELYALDKITGFAYSQRYAFWGIAAVCLLILVLCFLFILSGAGHKPGAEEPVAGYFFRVPYDVITAALVFAFCFALECIFEMPNDMMEAILLCLLFVAAVPAAAGWCAALAARIKCGGWLKYTLTGRILGALAWLLRALWRGILAIPLVPITAVMIVIVCTAELFGIAVAHRSAEALLLLWVLEKLILVPVVLWIAISLRRLQKGGQALADGDLAYRTNGSGMLPPFRRHAESLNAASAGMTKAVEARLKSERLRTELITNVSHDLKTPLTGIVSYIDLLKNAGTAEEREQYLEVLERQAQKLRKLTEDLIEVSKAGTGNVDVRLARGSVSELLRQALGEYEERIAAAGLETVLTLPDEELFAVLDGTLTWRVLDNLLSNACKYGQSGTRFYVSGARAGDRVRLTFRNISRDPLNVPAEELTERFVRGDRARTGDGSGLGLNIAQSLTELQGGTFAVTVDGDLFKAEITLPGA